MKNMRVKGSFTLEAALIFPTVLFIIFSIIYLSFYMHDRVTMEGIINDCLLQGRNLVQYEIDMDTNKQNTMLYLAENRVINQNDNGSKEEIIQMYLLGKLQKGLFIANVTSVEAKVSNEDITVIVNGHMKIPFIEFSRFFGNSGLNFIFEEKINRHDTKNNIRVIDIGMDLISKYR